MQIDFHYYATYSAAILAGYSHEESLTIAYSAQFVDCCTRTLLSTVGGPDAAATTQLQLEMMDARVDIPGIQDITRIWASFHFLPRDLNADVKKGSRIYKAKYRLICGPCSDLVADTVELAKDKSLQAVGIAMHVLGDTWAHRGFAGTPSQVINNTDYWFYELIPEGESYAERKVTFRHNPGAADDIEKGIYTNTIYQTEENSVMSLGHGRAGHLPDYSFMRYKYLPAWGDYEVILKDNPSEYYNAFCQMICAMKFLRGETEVFEKDRFETDAAAHYEEEIKAILNKRQLDSCADWKAFGEKLSGGKIPDFDIERYLPEYRNAQKQDRPDTFLGRFIDAALAQKNMVTQAVYSSGSLMSGNLEEGKTRPFQWFFDLIKISKEQKKGGQP